MTDKTLLIVDAVLAGASLLLAGYAAFTFYRVGKMRSMFGDKHKPVDLEEVLSVLASRIKNLDQGAQEMTQRVDEFRKHHTKSVQRLGLVRFNSFADEGGNMSFACALLDEYNNGIVLTSMHGRQQNRIYAKQIKNGMSETALSGEEQEAINRAIH